MNSMSKLRGLLILSLGLLLLLSTSEAEAKKKKKNRKAETPVSGTLDDGKLVVSWFSDDPLLFREADEIDYLWVREGFTIEGASLHVLEWPAPEIPDDRDAKDRRLATQMNRSMAELFYDAWNQEWHGTEVSTEGGDIEVSGRIVDVSTGSTAAKVLVGFGAGSGNTTIDLKFVDKASGELLLALHHRVVSGTSWSTTDSKFVNWALEVAEEIADKGAEKMYANGDRIDD